MALPGGLHITTPEFKSTIAIRKTPEANPIRVLSSGTWGTDAADLRQQLNDYLGSTTAAGVELVATENNSVSSGPGKQTTSLVNCLFMADSICAAMQTEFNAVMWWDLRNGQETGNNNSSTLYGGAFMAITASWTARILPLQRMSIQLTMLES